MKKILLFIVFIVLITLLLLSACGTQSKTESEIIDDLQSHGDFYSVQQVQIQELNIIKQQTDEPSKTDYILVSVLATNDRIQCNLSYELYYTLYNDGWYLDYVYPYDMDNWVITPLTPAEQYITDEAIAKEYTSYTYVDCEADLEYGTCVSTYTVGTNHEYAYVEGTIEAITYFDQTTAEWIIHRLDTVSATADWDLEGTWSARYSGASWHFDYLMDIEEVDNSTIHVTIYDKEDGTIFYDSNVALCPEYDTHTSDPQLGAYIEAETSSSGWETIKMHITLDDIYTEDIGTASGSHYYRIN